LTDLKSRGYVAKKLLQILVVIFSICFAHPVSAGSFNFGVGFELVDATNFDSDDFGWSFQLGYEIKETKHWNIGLEVDLFNGVTDENDINDYYADSSCMVFDSQAIYVTVRPKNWFLHFKAGVVKADYKTAFEDTDDIGLALGLSLVLGSGKLRLHLLDYQHYKIGGDSFNSISISVAVLLYCWK
jgi:hypothetical protein